MCRLLGFAAAGSNTSLNGVLGMQAIRDFRDLSEIHNDGWGLRAGHRAERVAVSA